MREIDITVKLSNYEEVLIMTRDDGETQTDFINRCDKHANYILGFKEVRAVVIRPALTKKQVLNTILNMIS